MRINITLRLFAGFVAIILFNVFYVVILSQLSDLNTLTTIIQRQDQINTNLGQISVLHSMQKRSRTSFETIKLPESIQNFITSGNSINAILDSTTGSIAIVLRLDSSVQKNKIASAELNSVGLLLRQDIRNLHAQHVNEFTEYVSACASAPSPSKDTALMMIQSDLIQSDEQLVALLSKAKEQLRSQTVLNMHEMERTITGALRLTQALLIGITIFSIIFAFLFSRAITHPLRKLKISASRIGKGEFSFSADGYPKDEIGDLAHAIAQMTVDLHTLQNELVHSKRLAAIGEIVASVNHEINNPLMIISGNAQFLEMSMDGYPDDMKERVQTILEETERISQVTKKLREIKNPVVEQYTSTGEHMINLDKSKDR